MDNETIKKKFLDLRREKGLSWADLAEKAGVNNYQTILNRFNTPGLSLATLEKLAALVGCDPWELLKPEPDQDNQTEQPAQAANAIRCPHCNKIILLNPTTTEQ